MYRHRRWLDDRVRQAAAERQTASLAAIIIILVLLIGGLFLVKQLHTISRIEDCLLAGRANCDDLLLGGRQ